MKCFHCGSDVSYDEIGLNKKLIARDADKFLCISCLAREFGVSKERLTEKIEEWREMGCMLFAQRERTHFSRPENQKSEKCS